MSIWFDNLKPYSKEELRAKLPKVGDVLQRRQTLGSTSSSEPSELKSCKVIYVNEEHLYYVVQFRNGCKQGFKLPDLEGRKKKFDSDGWGW